MDINDIVRALNQVLELGDQLDSAGGGVQGLTNGEHTTREACKVELSQLLLYIADGCSYVNDAQVSLISLILGDEYSGITAYKIKELAKSISAPDPNKSGALIAFQQADNVLSQQNGDYSSSLTNILISIYEAFGRLMVAVNENPIAQSRCDRVISQFKSKASLGSLDSSGVSESSVENSSNSDFEIDDDILTEYTGNDTHVTVPDGITRIGDSAFSVKKSIQTIVLPDSVTVIGESAFFSCESLETINLPEGLTEIETEAFWGCDSLTSLDMPSTVDTIGSDAFFFCSHLKRIRIPSTLTDIGDDAFMCCDNLETVVVYGGRKNDRILEDLSKHFMGSVRVLWESDEQADAKNEPVSQKASGTRSSSAHSSDTEKNESSLGTAKSEKKPTIKIQKKDEESENKTKQPVKNRTNFSLLDLKTLLDHEKYVGFHKVQGSGEYVSPDKIWAIRIPDGLTYTMDPAKVAKTIIGESHLLEAINDQFALFHSEGYLAAFGLTVFPYCFSYSKLSSPFHQLDTSYALEKAIKIVNEGDSAFRKFKQTRDVLVLINDSYRDKEQMVIEFRILCSEFDKIVTGRIAMQGPQNKLKEWEPMAFQMLESIERLPV